MSEKPNSLRTILILRLPTVRATNNKPFSFTSITYSPPVSKPEAYPYRPVFTSFKSLSISSLIIRRCSSGVNAFLSILNVLTSANSAFLSKYSSQNDTLLRLPLAAFAIATSVRTCSFVPCHTPAVIDLRRSHT